MNDFTLENNIFNFNNDSKFEIVISSRNGGVSSHEFKSLNLGLHVGDEIDDVIENRHLYANLLSKKVDKFIFMQQTHSSNCVEVFDEDAGAGLYDFDLGINDCDAVYTFSDNLVLNAMCADCTPVYFYSEVDNLKGVIHAGWQGTLKEITYHTLKQIISKHDIKVENLTVVIGPSINIESFEVDHDVYQKFNDANLLDNDNYYQKGSKYHLDIKNINKSQAGKLGIKNVFVSSIDTYTNKDLFSFRKNNITGRMCASIYTTNK